MTVNLLTCQCLISTHLDAKQIVKKLMCKTCSSVMNLVHIITYKKLAYVLFVSW